MEQWIQVLSTSWLRESFLGLYIPGFNWELRANSCSTDIPILIKRKLESLLITQFIGNFLNGGTSVLRILNYKKHQEKKNLPYQVMILCR